MATSKLYEGVTYSIPATGETNWGGSTGVDGFLIALADNVPQKTGGSFTLSADLDFGGTAHVKGIFKTRTANPAASGVLRLANNEGIGFRNAANSADLVLKANASNLLEFNGAVVQASPGSTTDNAVARFDGTTGLLQNSVVLVGDTGAVTGVTTLAASGAVTGTQFNGSISLGANGVSVGNGIANPASTDQIQFFTASTLRGSINQTGLWTIGASGGTQVHVANGSLNITSATGPNLIIKDTGTFATSADPHISFQDGSGVGALLGFTNAAAETFAINLERAGGTLAIQFGATTRIGINTTGIGFFNTTPAAKPTVTGSRGGNAALASLLTALATLGLITDSSS